MQWQKRLAKTPWEYCTATSKPWQKRHAFHVVMNYVLQANAYLNHRSLARTQRRHVIHTSRVEIPTWNKNPRRQTAKAQRQKPNAKSQTPTAQRENVRKSKRQKGQRQIAMHLRTERYGQTTLTMIASSLRQTELIKLETPKSWKHWDTSSDTMWRSSWPSAWVSYSTSSAWGSSSWTPSAWIQIVTWSTRISNELRVKIVSQKPYKCFQQIWKTQLSFNVAIKQSTTQ